MGTSNTASVAEKVVFLPESCILQHRPTSLNAAKALLTLNYPKKAKNAGANNSGAKKALPLNSLAQKERARISRHLLKLGAAPDPATYDLFQITHDGTLVDFKLKCLLVMGMCLSALAKGDVTAEQIRPYLFGFAEAYMKYELPAAGAADPMATLPRQLRIAKSK